MFNWNASIGKVLQGRIREEHAQQERMSLRRLRISRFCMDKVVPALEAMRAEFEAHGRMVDVRRTGNIVCLTIIHHGKVEFQHSVLVGSRRGSRGKRSDRPYRDRHGYARSVDRIYTFNDMRWLRQRAITRHVVAEFKKSMASRASGRV